MYALIGDIGNTLTKICLVDIKYFNVKKFIYIDSKIILNNKYLRVKLKKIIKKNQILNMLYFLV